MKVVFEDKMFGRWPIVIFFLLIVSWGYIGYKNYHPDPIGQEETPRSKNTDYLYSNDSVYYIHYVIDSAEAREYEPEDRRP